MPDNRPIKILDYAQTSTSPLNRLRLAIEHTGQWIGRTPECLLGVVLLAAPMFLSLASFPARLSLSFGPTKFLEATIEFLYFAVLFVPGAIRRFNWRHVLLMLTLAGIAYEVDTRRLVAIALPYPYGRLLSAATPVLLLVLGEWLLARPRAWRALAWAVVLVIGVTCAILVVELPVEYTNRFIVVRWTGGGQYKYLSTIVHWPALILLIWAALPAALRMARPTRRTQWLAGSAVGIALLAFMLFGHVAVYMIARHCVVHGGLFDRAMSVSILYWRSNPGDVEAVWKAIETADWSASRESVEFPRQDYRPLCIFMVAKDNRSTATARLAKMLLARPTQVLADCSAKTLAEEQRYETVPILMRFALTGVYNECREALEQMRIPQAALAIFRQDFVFGTITGRTRLSDIPIESKDHERLIVLLGGDAGQTLGDWIAYYDAVVDNVPTPLPAELAAETKRVAIAIEFYWNAQNLLTIGKGRLLEKRFQESGYQASRGELKALEPLLEVRRPPTAQDIASLNYPLLGDGFANAFHELSLQPPDWEVPTTSDLEREVVQYRERVESILDKYGVLSSPSTTQPSGD
jgi:hypothetical protein